MDPQAQTIWDALEFRAPALLRALGPLDDVQLRWRAPGAVNSIAWLLWHIAEVEDNWVRDRLYGQPKRFPFGVSVKQAAETAWPAKADLLQYLHEVRALTRDRLAAMTPADFDRTVKDATYGLLTVRQVWAGVATSAAWHGGQIVYAARLVAAGGPR